jgi:SAM-dependent methyltransferase
MSYRISECALCGGRDFAFVLRAKDFHYGNPGLYELAQCRACSLCFLDPMYNDAEVAAFYPKNYYSFTDQFGKEESPAYTRLVRAILGLREFRTHDPQFDKPGRVLDVGCGTGWFISQMRDLGWEVMGVEPNEAAAAYGKAKSSLNIFAGTLLEAALPPSSFDYVRLNHSFEHMSDPNRVLDEIHRILAPHGKLMIGVPNRASLNARLFGPYWYHLALPLHAYHYSTKTLVQMLKKHGFASERVIFNTHNAGIQGSTQFFLNRKTQPPRGDGRVMNSRIATALSVWIARLENVFRIGDQIEVTCIKL